MLFRSQIPFLSSDIPAPVKYAGISMADYEIVGSYEDEKDDTKAYQSTNTNLRGLESERKIQTGAPNPFVSANAESDIPSERVSIENSANPTEQELADSLSRYETENNKLEDKASEDLNRGEPVNDTVSLPED